MPLHALMPVIALWCAAVAGAQDPSLATACYDVGRELYSEVNRRFAVHCQQTRGLEVQMTLSFGATTQQAERIIAGSPIDVVCFNQVTDIDALVAAGLVAKDWDRRLAHRASPYFSTMAFLVRKGNHKQIRDWSDLAREDVSLVFPDPKTSGNGRYTYLAAWLFAKDRFGGDEAKTRAFVERVLSRATVHPAGGRGATELFMERGEGDVLITFESEVLNFASSATEDAANYEVVIPPTSVLAEFPVSVVDRVVDARGSRELAEAYLAFLESREIQELLTRFNLRVHHPEVAAANEVRFQATRLIDPVKSLGSWSEIDAAHFAPGAILDQLLAVAARTGDGADQDSSSPISR